MTSLFFGQLSSIGVPADEKVVRTTAVPVEHDAPAAMQTDMPQPQEVETDKNPNLGLVNRQLASRWFPRLFARPSWKEEVDAGYLHNAIIDRQVSSSGTAAAREADGEWGHGTMPYAVGIEPTGDLTDGGKLGNEYFKTNDHDIQETMGREMTVPPGYDADTSAKVSALGKVDARKAAMAATYNAFWNGGN